MSENFDMPKKDKTTWWGDYRLALNSYAFWKIGPLSLQLMRRDKEWQVTYLEEIQTKENENLWFFEDNYSEEIEQGKTHRHLFTQTEDGLKVMPRLPDRPVVVKTAKPFNIHPGQQAEIFVSIPLWLAVSVGADNLQIQELPIVRPSDTWFGPSTMEGDLCYSSTTQGRLTLQELPTRPHRATSSVLIKNNMDKTLTLEQFSLPAPYLSLFSTDEGGLWTESITLLNDDESDLAKVSVSEAPPKQNNNPTRVAEPRLKAHQNMLLRTFRVLFR